MNAFADKLTIVQNEDQVCLTDAGSSLRYQEGGDIAAQLMQGFTKCCICRKVKCTGTVVQDQEFWFLDNGTRDGETLFLSSGKVATILFQFEIKLTILAFDDLTRLGCCECIPDLCICGIVASPFYVFADRSFKEGCTLWYNTDLFTEILLAVTADILSINTDSHQVFRAGKVIELTQREYELLTFLASHPNKVYARIDLMEQVWNYGYVGDDARTVDVTVRRLREKIEEDPANPRYILTRRGAGYYFSTEA